MGISLTDIIEHAGSEPEETPVKDVTDFIKGRLLQAIQNLPPEIKELTEFELMKKLDPTPIDYALRRSFWNAIDQAEKLGRDSIFQTEVYKGICTQQTFNESVLPNPLRVAWLSRPVVDHSHFYEAINKVALQQILDYVKDNKITDPKVLATVVKIAEMSANRAYGAVAQKMQIQSKNLNIDVTGKPEANIPSSDQGQLTQRVEELQAKLLDQAKDVTPKE
jgi:hypothetical protein